MSMFTGVVTSILFAVAGGSFLASGQYLFGGVLLALAAVRALVLLRVVRNS
ncbi:MAG: hypothetical protein ACJAZO_004228 [Myxococcota bacterium]|jgi:hypothetical protein